MHTESEVGDKTDIPNLGAIFSLYSYQCVERKRNLSSFNVLDLISPYFARKYYSPPGVNLEFVSLSASFDLLKYLRIFVLNFSNTVKGVLISFLKKTDVLSNSENA